MSEVIEMEGKKHRIFPPIFVDKEKRIGFGILALFCLVIVGAYAFGGGGDVIADSVGCYVCGTWVPVREVGGTVSIEFSSDGSFNYFENMEDDWAKFSAAGTWEQTGNTITVEYRGLKETCVLKGRVLHDEDGIAWKKLR